MGERKPWVIRTRSASRIGDGVWVRLEDVGALVEAACEWVDANGGVATVADRRLEEVIRAMRTLYIIRPAGETEDSDG